MYTDEIECPKCKHQHAVGQNDDDSGDWDCEKCGFEFLVSIEYEPTYDCECATHEFGEYGEVENFPDARLCRHCGKAELRKIR